MTTTYVIKHPFKQSKILLSVNSDAWPASEFKF